jgi:hypothetical protein
MHLLFPTLLICLQLITPTSHQGCKSKVICFRSTHIPERLVLNLSTLGMCSFPTVRNQDLRTCTWSNKCCSIYARPYFCLLLTNVETFFCGSAEHCRTYGVIDRYVAMMSAVTRALYDKELLYCTYVGLRIFSCYIRQGHPL